MTIELITPVTGPCRVELEEEGTLLFDLLASDSEGRDLRIVAADWARAASNPAGQSS